MTWKADTDGSYAVGGNWTGNAVPANNDTAQVNSGGTCRIGNGTSVTAGSIQAGSGKVLVEGGSVMTGNFQVTGSQGILEAVSGVVTVTTDSRIAASGGMISIAGTTEAHFPKIVVGSSAGSTDTTFTISGDAVVTQDQTGGNQSRELWIGGNNNGDGTLIVENQAQLINKALGSNSSQVMVGRFAGGTGVLILRDQAVFEIDNDIANPATSNSRRLIVADTGSSGTVNLDGGSVTTIGFQSNGDGSTVNANGGTVKALRDEADFFRSFTGTGGVANRSVNLLAGGLTFDTNHFMVSIPSVLSGSGGITKLGDGTLALSGVNTFTGPVTVAGGELRLDEATLSDATAVSISNGGVLNQPHGMETMVASLTLDGVQVAQGGSWGSSVSNAVNRNDRYFSGTGVLQVGPLPPPDPAVSGLDSVEAVEPYFNGTFNPMAPGQSSGWTVVDAFPNLSFIDPMWLAEIPGTGDFLVVCKNGQLWRFPNDPDATQAQLTSVIDLSASTMVTGDQGFYQLAFHPQFGQAGSPNRDYAYVCYSFKPVIDPQYTQPSGNRSFWRISRLTWQPETGTFDPASELPLINQYDPQLWHNGGALFFDNDGFLHATCGDGGDGNDSFGNAQRIDLGFFSGILQIDVDNDPGRSHPIRRQPLENPGKPEGWPPSFSQGYMIPDDNPWLDPGGSVLEEYFAIGLRSPHAAHYDAETGDIWVGDVGQGTREELDRVTKGANCQWSYQEGLAGGPKAKPASLVGFDSPPVYDYDRNVGSCIIGGMRYRGAKWQAELAGKVLFADHARGVISTATPVAEGPPVIEEVFAGFRTGSKTGLANFCTDSAGEIYLMDINGTNQPGGKIRKLAVEPPAPEPPQFLSDTGVFTDLTTLSTAPGVIPYDVASPLWSDGADKRRWVIIPNDGYPNTPAEKIAFSENDKWVFPPGTVFVKHFEMPVDERNPSLLKRLETRFLVCTENGGKYGVTYKWNEAGTDAELLAHGETLDFDVTLQNGGTEPRHWDIPSRSDCLLCHNPAAGQALGFRTHQLNRTFFYEATGRTVNQLTTLSSIGLLDQRPSPEEISDYLEARGLTDETAPLEHRVRSYLDANCSHCHQPGATVEYFDTRLGTPLFTQGIVNGPILGVFDLGPDGRYLKPGDPANSAVFIRMANVSNGAAMPPLAKNLLDHHAIDQLEEYIQSLTPAEFEPAEGRPARCNLGGPSGTVTGPFEVTIVFDMDVTDFEAQDIQVTGGLVGGLRGKGYYYVATVIPTEPDVQVSVESLAIANGNLPSNTLSLVYQPTYENWASAHGIGGSAKTDDDDQDGIVNLLEYAFNLDPRLADHRILDPAANPPAGLPGMVVEPDSGGRRLVLQYLRRAGIPELTYIAEFGDTIDGFQAAVAEPQVDSLGSGWEQVTVPDMAASGAEVRRFGRVRVQWDTP